MTVCTSLCCEGNTRKKVEYNGSMIYLFGEDERISRMDWYQYSRCRLLRGKLGRTEDDGGGLQQRINSSLQPTLIRRLERGSGKRNELDRFNAGTLGLVFELSLTCKRGMRDDGEREYVRFDRV